MPIEPGTDVATFLVGHQIKVNCEWHFTSQSTVSIVGARTQRSYVHKHTLTHIHHTPIYRHQFSPRSKRTKRVEDQTPQTEPFAWRNKQ